MTALVDEATRRSLAFNVGGRRPWPDDLPARILTRLEGWSDDEGFAHDLFLDVLLGSARQRALRASGSGKARRSSGWSVKLFPLCPIDLPLPGRRLLSSAAPAVVARHRRPTSPSNSLARRENQRGRSIGQGARHRYSFSYFVMLAFIATPSPWPPTVD